MKTLLLAPCLLACSALAAPPAPDEARAVLDLVDAAAPAHVALARELWQAAELGFQERRSADLLCAALEQAGFRVTRGVAGMPTAFVAEWGGGRPVLGVLGEFDALPGMSQRAQAAREPVREGAPGHACGHNLFAPGIGHPSPPTPRRRGVNLSLIPTMTSSRAGRRALLHRS